MSHKSALITGAAQRIGKAMALDLAQKGWDIALHYHQNEEKARNTQQEIQNLGVVCEIFQADLSDENHYGPLMEKIMAHFPALSLFIHGASVFEPCAFLETNLDAYNRNMNLHLKAPYFLSQSFAKHCESGQIIYMLDTNVDRYKTTYFPYQLSKKALRELTKLQAKTLAPKIRVNAICPGIILPPPDSDLKETDALIAKTPLQKQGAVEDLIRGLSYLIESDFVTGECLFIDGGERLV